VDAAAAMGALQRRRGCGRSQGHRRGYNDNGIVDAKASSGQTSRIVITAGATTTRVFVDV
jgi:hypothetical protein